MKTVQRYCFLFTDCIVLGQPVTKGDATFSGQLSMKQVFMLSGSVLKLDVKAHLKNSWVVQVRLSLRLRGLWLVHNGSSCSTRFLLFFIVLRRPLSASSSSVRKGQTNERNG